MIRLSPKEIYAAHLIRRNELSNEEPGQSLKGEGSLAEEYGLKRNEIRRVLSYLTNTQELEVRRGVGNFCLFGFRENIHIGHDLKPISSYLDGGEVLIAPNKNAEFINEIVRARTAIGKYIQPDKTIHTRIKRYKNYHNLKRVVMYSDHLFIGNLWNFEKLDGILSRRIKISEVYKAHEIEWARYMTHITSRPSTKSEVSLLNIGTYDTIMETIGSNVQTNLNREKLGDACYSPLEITLSYWPNHFWNLRVEGNKGRAS